MAANLLPRAKRRLLRAARAGLLAYARAAPRDPWTPGAERRVTFWLNNAWGMGGTIRATWSLAGWLAENGYEVDVLSSVRGRETPFFGAPPPGVRLIALDDRRPDGAPRGPARLLRALLKDRGSVLVHPDDLRYGNQSLWTDLRVARLLRRRTGFVFGTRPGINLALARLALPGAIVVGQEHMHLRHHVPPLREAMRRRYRSLAAVTVLTERDLRRYRRFLGRKARVERIPNAARAMGGPPVDLSATTVLAAGRLSPQKGFDRLITAFAQVAETHPGWRLRIYGEGHLRPKLTARIEALGLAGRVTLEGAVGNLGEEMAKASIFALSSKFEGFPLTLLEAMGKGMAVVSFDCPTGPGEIVEDHRNGILVPARDTGAFAAGLAELMADEALRRRCAAAAADTAQAYTMAAIGPRWAALMEALWAERGAGVSGPSAAAPPAPARPAA